METLLPQVANYGFPMVLSWYLLVRMEGSRHNRFFSRLENRYVHKILLLVDFAHLQPAF
ncbi:YvrJ family protein [Phascolarctobacterium faecium]|uniref:YvrJ family protein n=1 Tax=Phascolarctobacterium faecium TaxID=33025 RepID=UPI00300ED4F3